MTALYHLAVLGAPEPEHVAALEQVGAQAVGQFGLALGKEVAWHFGRVTDFRPDQRCAAAAAYFNRGDEGEDELANLLTRAVPVLPVVSSSGATEAILPPALTHLNALRLDDVGIERVATALFECAGLLPRQRRVFLSVSEKPGRSGSGRHDEALTPIEHCPRHGRVLRGDRDDCLPVAPALGQRDRPAAHIVGLALGRVEQRPGAHHQQRAQVRVTRLGDAPQPRLAVRTVLPEQRPIASR